MAESAPHRLFNFHERLGKGGFGEVYRATMTNPSGLAQVVAVKVLHAKFAPGSPAVLRLRDEGRLMAALQHPNILRVIDLLTLNGRSALIAEYMEGADVNTLVRAGKLPTRVGLEIIAAASRGLDGAWNGRSPDTGEPLRLVHRDIKPHNIRVGPHGDVKVLDFGIARTDKLEREAETETHMVLGSLPYLSPEACVSPNLTVKADVYAMGCTLFEILAGKRMTTGKAPAAVYSMLSVESLHNEHRAARAGLLPDDAVLRDIVLRATAFSADDRPDAAELADLCEDAAARFADQPTLARWARSYTWPPPAAETGDLSGTTMNDAMTGSNSHEFVRHPVEPVSVEVKTASHPAVPPASVTGSGARRLGLGLGVSALLVAAGLFVCAGGVVVSGLLGMPGSGTDAPVNEAVVPVVDPPEKVGVPVEEPPTEDVEATDGSQDPPVEPPSEEGTADAPSTASPVADPVTRPRAVDPTPTPNVSEPVASVKPTPVKPPPPKEVPPKEVPTKTVLADSPKLSKVVFTKGGTEYEPGNVPPGTYELMTDFGAGLKSDGTVVVEPGEQVDIACSTRKQMCWVK